MNEEMKEKIREKTQRLLKGFRTAKEFVDRNKKKMAVALLLSQQVGQTVLASSSVKDKKTDPISILANQQVTANNADWSTYLNEGKRLSEKEMTYLVNKAIKDGHLIPAPGFTNDFEVYVVNPDNPGPFAVEENFKAMMDEGKLVCVERENVEKVTVDQFSKGVPIQGTINNAVRVGDYYNPNNYREVETEKSTKDGAKKTVNLIQHYTADVDMPTLIQTSKEEGNTITVRYPNDPRLINPGGFSVTKFSENEDGETTTIDYAQDGNTVVRTVHYGDETKGIATYAELIMPDGNKCTVVDYRNSICVNVGGNVTEVSTRTIEWDKKIQGNDDNTSFDYVCSGVLKKGKGWFDNLQKHDNMNKANNNTNGYNGK